YSVFTCRASSTLHVTQNRCSCLHTCRLFDSLCHVDRISDTLSVNDDIILLTAFLALFDIRDDSLLVVVMLFRHQNALSAVGDTTPQSKITCVTAHNLDDAAALMRCG